MAMPRKSNIGDKHGMLTLLEWIDCRFSLFQCDCGNTCTKRSADVRNGKIISCGCAKNQDKITHGHTANRKKEKLYDVWIAIKRRCYKENSNDYHLYGGRGIIMCEEWKNNYSLFRDWSISNGYSDDLTIDRIDNNGNYEPSNCRWVTMKINANNTRKNNVITYKGETHTLSEWAELLGINRTTLSARLNDYGWDIERAFTELPYRGKNQYQ